MVVQYSSKFRENVSCSKNYQQTQEDKCQTVDHVTSLLLPNRNRLLMKNLNYIAWKVLFDFTSC